MSTKSPFAVLAVTLALSATIPTHGATGEGEPARLDWLSDLSGEASLRGFANQADDLQKERRKGEALLDLEFNIVASPVNALFLDVAWTTGTGDSAIDGLAISPMELNYSWRLFLEHTEGRHLYRLGGHHACDHVIYKEQEPWYEKSDVPTDVYYSAIFLSAGTHTVRPIAQARGVFDGPPASRFQRLVWYVEGAYYIRSLGSMDKQTLYGGNDWQWRFLADLRYPLLTGKAAALFVNNRTDLLLDIDNEAYWTDLIQLEVFLPPGAFAVSFFGGWYVVDQHPRDGIEGAVELGLRLLF